MSVSSECKQVKYMGVAQLHNGIHRRIGERNKKKNHLHYTKHLNKYVFGSCFNTNIQVYFMHLPHPFLYIINPLFMPPLFFFLYVCVWGRGGDILFLCMLCSHFVCFFCFSFLLSLHVYPSICTFMFISFNYIFFASFFFFFLTHRFFIRSVRPISIRSFAFHWKCTHQ